MPGIIFSSQKIHLRTKEILSGQQFVAQQNDNHRYQMDHELKVVGTIVNQVFDTQCKPEAEGTMNENTQFKK